MWPKYRADTGTHLVAARRDPDVKSPDFFRIGA
jgi:hypothetical protein